MERVRQCPWFRLGKPRYNLGHFAIQLSPPGPTSTQSPTVSRNAGRPAVPHAKRARHEREGSDHLSHRNLAALLEVPHSAEAFAARPKPTPLITLTRKHRPGNLSGEIIENSER